MSIKSVQEKLRKKWNKYCFTTTVFLFVSIILFFSSITYFFNGVTLVKGSQLTYEGILFLLGMGVLVVINMSFFSFLLKRYYLYQKNCLEKLEKEYEVKQ